MLGERDEDSKVRMMRLIDGNPSISQREIAQNLELSIGKVNYLIRALVERGMVKVDNFRASGNKRAYAYYLTPVGICEKAVLTHRFLSRKLIEYEHLRAEISDLQIEVTMSPTVNVVQFQTNTQGI